MIKTIYNVVYALFKHITMFKRALTKNKSTIL